MNQIRLHTCLPVNGQEQQQLGTAVGTKTGGHLFHVLFAILFISHSLL
jgi:hypothetical protein